MEDIRGVGVREEDAMGRVRQSQAICCSDPQTEKPKHVIEVRLRHL